MDKTLKEKILKEESKKVSFSNIPRVKITCSFDEYASMNGYITIEELNNRLKNIEGV